jgi:hypothetical protein
MKPIVFFIGAGASFGATLGRVSPESPPLMPELYDRLAHRFPAAWGPASKRAAHAERYRVDFEKTFSEVDLRLAPDLPPGVPGADGLTVLEAQRPLAIYFSEFVLDHSQKDYYSRLLRYLDKIELVEKSFFSTLNYECLLEQSMINLGFHVNYLIDEARAVLDASAGADWPPLRWSREILNVAKLHGSSNFYFRNDWRVTTQLAARAVVETAIDVSDARAPISEGSALERFPIMTQTSPGREDFAASGKILQIRRMWAAVVGDASLIVIIGLAPRRYDRHIWDPLHAASGELVYIGSQSDAGRWRECNPRVRWLGPTFEKGFCPLLRTLSTRKRKR